MKLLTDLLYKCVENDLQFSYMGELGSVRVIKIVDGEHVLSVDGHIEENRYYTPKESLTKMHEEVDVYIAQEYIKTSEESGTVFDEDGEIDEYYEEARAKLTEYERKLKESGHTESDFS